MNLALRAARSSYHPHPLIDSLTQKTDRITFQPGKFHCSKSGNNDNMEKGSQNHSQKNGDVMSHSFGEGYSTRSDEEGFGGVYGGNQSVPKPGDKEEIHENHPDYDRTQGSDVKEKEKGRNTTDASESSSE